MSNSHTNPGWMKAWPATGPIGKQDKAPDEAKAKGWTVADMKNDRKFIYPFENK